MTENLREPTPHDFSAASAQEGVPNYGIADDFPILWQMAQEYDFAERLGGCNSNLHAEVDEALRELCNARRFAHEHGETWMEADHA